MSWQDPRATQQQQQNGPRESLFLNLKDELRVRVVGDPEFFERHWTRGRAGKDVTVRCPGSTVCPICEMGEKARVRAIFPVLDRKTGKMKIVDVPQIVVGYIKALKEGEWGDPVNYDLTIKQVPTGKKTDYQVIPNMPSPLSALDTQEISRFFTSVDYKKFATPHTREEAMAILNGTTLPRNTMAQTPAALLPGVQLPQAPQQPTQPQYAPAQVQTNGTAYAPQPQPAYQVPQEPSQTVAQPWHQPQVPQAPVQAAYVPPAPAVAQPVYVPQAPAQPAYVPPPAPAVQMAPPSQQPSAPAITDQMLKTFMPGSK